MTEEKMSGQSDTVFTDYHCAYPKHADFDLRIFKSLCEGKVASAIAAEHACDSHAICASLCRLKEYMTTGDLFSIVEIFRYVFYKASITLSAPTTMRSVIDTLYLAASEGGMISNEDTKEVFAQLFALTDDMPAQVANDVFDAVCKICDVYEYISFTEGVKVGFQLGKELTT